MILGKQSTPVIEQYYEIAWYKSQSFVNRVWYKSQSFVNGVWYKSQSFVNGVWYKNQSFVNRVWYKNQSFVNRVWYKNQSFVNPVSLLLLIRLHVQSSSNPVSYVYYLVTFLFTVLGLQQLSSRQGLAEVRVASLEGEVYSKYWKGSLVYSLSGEALIH